jgi:hypothetical protein
MKLTRDLREFIELLNAHRVEYLVVGGWAFGYHATPRYTGDLDFFVRCNLENCARLKNVLSEFGFTELGGFEKSFLQAGRIIQFGLPPSRIDILTDISGVTFEEVWNSRETGELEGLRVHLINRECLIRNKTAAGRAKDIADVEALERTRPKARL